MPVTVSYPGVYIQEIPSGAHTIAGVSTSVTAFIGRTFMGPVNTPIAIGGMAEFQRMFGGLTQQYPLSYAVRDFFQNGGGEAVVVRLFAPTYSQAYPQLAAAADASAAATAVLNAATPSLGAGSTALTQALIATATSVASAFATATYPGGVGKAAVQNRAAAGMTSWFGDYFATNPTKTVADLTAEGEKVAAGTDGTVVSSAAPVTLASVLVQSPAGLGDAVAGALLTQQAVWKAAEAASPTPQSVFQAGSQAASGLQAGPRRSAGLALVNVLQLVWAATPSDTAAQLATATGTVSGGATPVTAAVQRALGLSPAAVAAAGPAIDAAAMVNGAAAQAAYKAGATAADVDKAVNAEITTAAFTGPALAVATAMKTAADGEAGSVADMLLDLVKAAAGPVGGSAGPVGGSLPSLSLDAASPGDWPNGALSVAFDQTNVPDPSFFNLRVAFAPLGGTPAAEQFAGVSLRPDAGSRRLDRVLAAQSNLVRFTGIDYSQAQVSVPPLPLPGAVGTVPGSGPGAGTGSEPLAEMDYLGDADAKTGMYALDHFDLFNLLVVPPDTWDGVANQPEWMLSVFQTAATYCRQRRAFLLVDPPTLWTNEWKQGQTSAIDIQDLGSYGPEGENAAVYFPNLVEGDPLQNGSPITMAPSGAVAGIFARTDAARGVWKAPAGINDGAISGIISLSAKLTDLENGMLNPLGINVLRSFPVYGPVVWGARTLKGSDALSDDYKFVPVRRLALYIEESLYRGTQWAVFEPNAEPLWSSLRLAVGGFMNDLFRQGAFAGTSAGQAYSVRCDATTTTQNDIDLGVVNVQVGFAPLKPAEFVVITIQQIAGQTAT